MKKSIILLLALSLFGFSCGSGNTTDFLEQFIGKIYLEKKPGSLFNRMTETMAQNIKDRKLGIYSAKERLSEKYTGHSLTRIKTVNLPGRRLVYGLIKQRDRRNRTSYRTFLAKFTQKKIKPDNKILWILYDLFIVRGKKIPHAKEVIKVTGITEKTVKIIKNLKQKVHFIFFERRPDTLTSHLLKELAVHNPTKISISFYNPLIERGTASSYGIKDNGYLVVEREKIRYTIKTSDLFFSKLLRNNRTRAYYEGERVIMSALHRVEGADCTILYVTGHGERDAKDKKFKGTTHLFKALGNFGFKTKIGPIPNSSPSNTIMFFADPRYNINMREKKVINTFLKNGGKAVFFLEKPIPASFNNLLAVFGLKQMYQTIVDPYHKDFLGGPTWFEIFVTPHPATINLLNRYKFQMLMAETVGFTLLKQKKPEYDAHSMITTSTNGWAEVHFEKDKPDNLGFTRGYDTMGPISLGYSISGKGKNKGKALVIGDMDFISNRLFMTKISNWFLFREILNWLFSPEIFSIKPRAYKGKLIRRFH